VCAALSRAVGEFVSDLVNGAQVAPHRLGHQRPHVVEA